ncbi:MAG: XdhC family protein, partial [Rhodoferax sp.]|nr:XdhC family protein [Rhodoferax sp.]
WGSSPRPLGSIMAMTADGTVAGSVSGGCIEDDLIARFSPAVSGKPPPARDQVDRLLIPSGPPQFLKYGVSADEAHRFGLPCGGTLELLLEFNPQTEPLIELVAALESGRLMQRRVYLSDGAVQVAEGAVEAGLQRTAQELVNSFGPEYRLLIIGAGQITECLASMALFCGFAVSVCDPREEYLGTWSLAQVRILRDMPDDVVIAMKPDQRTCVVALTHDPKLDDLALMEALKTDAFYVGAIGSRRNNQMRRERLMEHFGLTMEEMQRLRGPVGIYIGSKTPPEIAVSVMAEILAFKNGIKLPESLDIETSKTKGLLPGWEAEPAASVCAITAPPP